MISAHSEYLDRVIEKLNAIKENEQLLEDCAKMIYRVVINGGFLYIFGTGHSHMFAEELFYRAGGMLRVWPILDEKLMLHISASESTEYERESGIGAKLMSEANITEKDVLLIASNSGRNSAAVEMAILAKKVGAKVIALTSVKHSSQESSRHESGKRLFEVSDIVLDNAGEWGDACIEVGGAKVSPTSTVIGCAMLQAIIARVVELGFENGVDIETFSSSNISGGDEHNAELLEKYKPLIKML